MNKQIKVAVQFFGHLRTFEDCFSSVKKQLLDIYDCDVFMHTWSKTNHQTHKWGDKYGELQDVDDKILNKIHEWYQPKLIKVEDQAEIGKIINIPEMQADNLQAFVPMKFMYYAKMVVNRLRHEYQKNNHTSYDYVVMIRPDVCLYFPFSIEKIDRQIHLTNSCARFCAFSSRKSPDNIVIGNMMSDILYLGTPEVMDKIVNALSNVDFNVNRHNILNPEVFCSTELLKNSIGSYFIPYLHEKDWLLVRSRKRQFALKEVIKGIIDISLKRKKKLFAFKILSVLPISLFEVKIKIFNQFYIIFSIGKFTKSVMDFSD